MGKITISGFYDEISGSLSKQIAVLHELGEHPLASANSGYANCYFKLAVDIPNMSGFSTPIGTNTAVFSGFFDGNNKTLSGININKAGGYVGLFGYTSGATIQHLTISGSVKGSKYVGGVVGYALNTTIYNVINNVSVSTYDNQYVDYSIVRYDAHVPNGTEGVRDMIHDKNSDTKYCTSSNGAMSFVIEVPDDVVLSGFAIQNAADTNLYPKRTPKAVYIWGSDKRTSLSDKTDKGSAYGLSPSSAGEGDKWTSVYGSDDIQLGSDRLARKEYSFSTLRRYKYYWIRIVGANGQLQFAEFDALAIGNATGGIVGYASGTSGNGTQFSNVKNNSSVSAGSYTGGIVGRADGIVPFTDCENTGDIFGFDGVAGILGAMTNNANVTITSCQNSGTITSSPESNGVAGIIGRSEAASNKLIVQGCKNTAGITGDRNVGGIGGRIETTRNDKDSLAFANCYNEGKITATKYGTVGGIAGYFFANGTSTNDVATISYCFSSGEVSTNNTDSNKNIGGIVGNPRASTLTSTRVYNCYTTNTSYGISGTATATVDNTNYVIASGAPAPSTTNGGKYLVYDPAFNFNPAIIKVGSETPFDSWTAIAEYVNATVHGEVVRVFNNINGFKVWGDIAPSSSQYFLSKTGVSSSDYLTPSKVENSNPTNAADRSNTATFTITAWYGANTNSDIYCTISTVTIDDSRNNIYNGQQQGFERSAVRNPNTNNSVYGVVFDYYNANVTPIESFICAFDADGNKIANSKNPYQVGAYNTTVFVKIGDVIVGKRVNRVFEIKQETINIEWKWTDSLGENIAFIYKT